MNDLEMPFENDDSLEWYSQWNGTNGNYEDANWNYPPLLFFIAYDTGTKIWYFVVIVVNYLLEKH